MSLNIAINGFGRIGKAFLRAVLHDEQSQKKLNISAINIGPVDPTNIALDFQYDSVLGKFTGNITYENGQLHIDGHSIQILTETDPQNLPWKKLNINFVVDASGRFTNIKDANKHITAGSKKVLITSPTKDEDITIIPGINDKTYDTSKHKIISLGSCTTNCFAPMVKVIQDAFGIERGTMTTIHSYTNDQVLLDGFHKDPRRGRAAALNMIPTKTGAGDVIIKLFPELTEKLTATAIRLPTPDVSIVDFAFITKKEISKKNLNEAFEKASKTTLKEIVAYSTLPLVSSDYINSPYSCIIDSLLTQAHGNMGKVFGWYDNEMGYSMRLKDFLLGMN